LIEEHTMQFGAITGYVDLAQIVLYLFWLFFAGLIFYLVREGKREGFPMEADGLSKEVKGWFLPDPKIYKTVHGDVHMPDLKKGEPPYSASGTYASPGSPIDPKGDPLTAGVGAGAYANRADTPDMMADGHVKIVPLRVAKANGISHKDTDPRGLPVIGGDNKVAGTVRDLWLDQAEMMFRYLEVEVASVGGGRRVLLPIPFARIGSKDVRVNSIYSHQFGNVPQLRHPDQVTFLEEEKISAYYGAGTLYAHPSRSGPWI
jgi:photosynthetic reaction center H subunit